MPRSIVRRNIFSFVFFFLTVFSVNRMQAETVHLNSRFAYLTGITYEFIFSCTDTISDSAGTFFAESDDTRQTIPPENIIRNENVFTLKEICFSDAGRYEIKSAGGRTLFSIIVIPGWLSLLPPLMAIILALITRQVLIALFAGVWLGAFFLYEYNIFKGFLNTFTEYIGKAPADPERISILIFTLTLGGMVGVISRSGGTAGIVKKLSKFASNSRKGQVSTWMMGVLIFFDVYANTLIVGNTMRPLTDKLKISREKLSFLVDATAAPVANIAIISTWIGYELSLISESFNKIGLEQNAYLTFIKTIPYNFYPIFTLAFGLIIALTGRDLFAMLKAEKRAQSGQVLREGAAPLSDLSNSGLHTKKGMPLRWYNAAIPVSVVIITTLAGLWFTGLSGISAEANISSMGFIQYASTVIGQANSFSVLMWAAFFGSFAAIILAVSQKILDLNEAMTAWVNGVKSMIMAALILTMAWAIGNICKDLQTAEYVINLTQGLLSPQLLPLLSFIIAGIIAFSTGTSWGTMAILAPIVIPLAYHLPLSDPAISAGAQQSIFLSAIASILAGATFGDHCSPISDTTIMSSMASGADHIDHVRTQLPYAVIAALVSIVFGYLPAGFGFHGWMTLLLLAAGIFTIFLIIRFAGKRAADK